METVNIILAILIYFILPVVIIFGAIIIFRRRRLREMGKSSSLKDKPLNKDDIRDIKADESKDARHTKQAPKNIDPETGRQPDEGTSPS